MTLRTTSQHRGVSLIEALVAMAVMAFGMLGLAGLQASLRGNADQARQRAEAVRMAQVSLEAMRNFSVLGVTAGASSFDGIVAAGPANAAPPDVNTTFSVQSFVADFPQAGDEQQVAAHKRVIVNIGWQDRNSLQQSVRFGSIVSAMAPEIAAALATPGDVSPGQQMGRRNRVVPVGAVDQGNGTSKFAPPGAGAGVSWTFNNFSGHITQTCVLAVCVDFDGRLLSGFVRFATAAGGATSADAETPPSMSLVNGAGEAVTVSVTLTSPVAGLVVACFQDPQPSYVAYYCALPAPAPDRSWSGRANVALPAGFGLAASVADVTAGLYRVCRYTTAAARVFPQLVVPAIRNVDHPLDYALVGESLAGQNFLVVRASNGAVPPSPNACPANDASTPYVDGSTWHHQPES